MRVARESGRTEPAAAPKRPGSRASSARPRSSRSASRSTKPSEVRVPSQVMTCLSCGSSGRRACSFLTCSSFSAKAKAEPESERMKAHSSAMLDG